MKKIILFMILLCGFIIYIFMFRNYKVYIGHRKVKFYFEVTDSKSGQYLDSAIISIFDPDRPYLGTIKEVCTDNKGKAVIIEDCTVYGRSGLMGESGVVSYPPWEFRVSREGYETTEPIALWDRIGQKGSINSSDPDTVKIKISKLPGPASTTRPGG